MLPAESNREPGGAGGLFQAILHISPSFTFFQFFGLPIPFGGSSAHIHVVGRLNGGHFGQQL